MSALALISDLMVQSQAAGAAQRAGMTLDLAISCEALLEKAEALRPTLVILDLSHRGLDLRELLSELKQHLAPGATILAFGPHVHREQLSAAEAAGCDLVISRGQFHAQAEQLLKRYGSEQA